MNNKVFERWGLELRVGLAALICLTFGMNLFGAGIPWSNGQALEYSITGLSSPDSVAVDAAHGKIYVTERGKNRVLRFAYPLTAGTPVESAEMVFGQSDFTGTSANRGGSADANTISLPYGLAVASNGDLWVADYDNNRLLKYTSAWTAVSGVAASVVLGQGNFTSTTAAVAANGLSHPCGMSFDSSDNLWVADMSNCRVLRFANASSKTSGASADSVLGQADFTSNYSNRGGSTAANSMGSVYGLGASGTTLWVADYANHRVLRFANAASKANGAAADGVLGQLNFNAKSGNMGGSISASSVYYPGGVAADSADTLYVNDSFNNRVLIFVDASSKANGAAADYYLGASSFTTSGFMSTPWHVVYDNTYHRLLVGNTGASRIDQFYNCYTTSLTLNSTPNPSTIVGAQVDFTATVTTANSGPVPTGYVSFNEGASTLGTASIDGTGKAVFSTTALADGTHSIFAVLTNTPTHKGSQSSPLAQVIGKYTPAFTLVSSPNPSTEGGRAVFTATVTPPSGAPTPTGSVEFFVDDVSGATVNLTTGEAAWTNTTLTVGAHVIKAVYNGDDNFRVMNDTVDQTVNPAGQYILNPVANVECDSDGSTTIVYDGNYYGGYVYSGAYGGYTFYCAYKFDLSSLSGTILSANLVVRVADKSMDGTMTDPKVALHTSEDDAWSDALPPFTAPLSVLSPALNEYSFNALTADDWLTNDVASFVTTQYSGDQTATFVFKSDGVTGDNYIGFYSRERDETMRPVLLVQMAPPDVTGPTITNVTVPSNATYVAGQNLDFTVTFDEPVLVAAGTPDLPITLDTGGTVQAAYVSGSGLKDLVFRYTIVSGNLDVDGITVGSAIVPNGATLKDAAGNAAALGLNGVGSTSGVLVDAVAPTITISDPSPTVTTTGPVEFTVTYADSSMNAVTLASTDITLNRTSTADGTISVTGTGWTRTVTISDITGHGTLGISIASGTASDTFANPAPAAGPSATVTVNLLPAISGTVSGQAVNDNATLAPFTGVTIANTDVPDQSLTCTVSLDHSGNGVFTPASLTASGFSSIGAGAYSLDGTAGDITTAIRLLVFAPTLNHVPRGSTETTTFAISVTDGVFAPVADNVTTVVATSVNHSPTAVADAVERFATQGVKVSTTTLLGNDTDPDSDTLSITEVSATSPNGASIYLAGSWIHYVPAAGFANADTFTYTISDAKGGVSTGTVTVTIKTDDALSSNQVGAIQVMGPDQYRITFGGIPGRTYTIQFMDISLPPPPVWQTLGTATASPTGIMTYDDNSSSPMRLYRTVYP